MSGPNGQDNHAGQEVRGQRPAQAGVTNFFQQYLGAKTLNSTFVFQNPGSYNLGIQYSNSSQVNGAQDPKPGMEAISPRRDSVSSSQSSQSTSFHPMSPQ